MRSTGWRSRACARECGTAVQLSLRPNRLVFASPRWLRRLHRGLIAVELSVAFLIADSVLGGMVSHLGVIAAPPIAVLWIGTALDVLFSLIELWGWWLVTTPEPSREGANGESGSVRRWVRSLAVCCAVLRLFSTLVSVLQVGSRSGGAIPGAVSSLVFAVLILGRRSSLKTLPCVLDHCCSRQSVLPGRSHG